MFFNLKKNDFYLINFKKMISFEEFFSNVWEIERNLTKKLFSLQKIVNQMKANGMLNKYFVI